MVCKIFKNCYKFNKDSVRIIFYKQHLVQTVCYCILASEEDQIRYFERIKEMSGKACSEQSAVNGDANSGEEALKFGLNKEGSTISHLKTSLQPHSKLNDQQKKHTTGQQPLQQM